METKATSGRGEENQGAQASLPPAVRAAAAWGPCQGQQLLEGLGGGPAGAPGLPPQLAPAHWLCVPEHGQAPGPLLPVNGATTSLAQPHLHTSTSSAQAAWKVYGHGPG